MPVPPFPRLSTPRLLLLPLRLEDADAIQALFPQDGIVTLMNASVPWPYPADGALTYVRDVALPAMEAGREWHWTLRLRDRPGNLFGLVSLVEGGDDHRGYWLDPAFHGRGLMTEACSATAEFWFDVLGRPVLREFKAAANEASRRLSIKSGMRVVRREPRQYVSGLLPAELWEVTAEEWRASRR